MKDVQCSQCGKKRKVSGKAFYAWTDGKASMIKGGDGKWHCANGYGCSKTEGVRWK